MPISKSVNPFQNSQSLPFFPLSPSFKYSQYGTYAAVSISAVLGGGLSKEAEQKSYQFNQLCSSLTWSVCVCVFALVFFLLLFLTALWLATSRVDSLSLIPSSFPLTLVVFVVDYSSTHMFRSLALYPLLLQLLPVLENCHTLRERDATLNSTRTGSVP